MKIKDLRKLESKLNQIYNHMDKIDVCLAQIHQMGIKQMETETCQKKKKWT